MKVEIPENVATLLYLGSGDEIEWEVMVEQGKQPVAIMKKALAIRVKLE